MFPEPRRCSLHTQSGRRHRSPVRRCHEDRFWCPGRGTDHRFGVHSQFQSPLRPIDRSRQVCHQRGDQTIRDRCSLVRHRRGHPGGHGKLRSGAGRNHLSGQVLSQPQRTLHRTIPDTRRKIGTHRQRRLRRIPKNGRGRDLRHRNLWKHRPGVRGGGHGMQPLHEEFPCATRTVANAILQKTVVAHQQDLWDAGLLSPLVGTRGRWFCDRQWTKRQTNQVHGCSQKSL
mmetsp:Transcript_4789/g.10557  ORF Transcript_4789/g.10557 Transcript_4789/m.10557 type:complete len:229 (+) Transcript_4789:452-1138(+)